MSDSSDCRWTDGKGLSWAACLSVFFKGLVMVPKVQLSTQQKGLSLTYSKQSHWASSLVHRHSAKFLACVVLQIRAAATDTSAKDCSWYLSARAHFILWWISVSSEMPHVPIELWKRALMYCSLSEFCLYVGKITLHVAIGVVGLARCFKNLGSSSGQSPNRLSLGSPGCRTCLALCHVHGLWQCSC